MGAWAYGGPGLPLIACGAEIERDRGSFTAMEAIKRVYREWLDGIWGETKWPGLPPLKEYTSRHEYLEFLIFLPEQPSENSHQLNVLEVHALACGYRYDHFGTDPTVIRISMPEAVLPSMACAWPWPQPGPVKFGPSAKERQANFEAKQAAHLKAVSEYAAQYLEQSYAAWRLQPSNRTCVAPNPLHESLVSCTEFSLTLWSDGGPETRRAIRRLRRRALADDLRSDTVAYKNHASGVEERALVIEERALVVKDRARMIEDRSRMVTDCTRMVKDRSRMGEDRSRMVEDRSRMVEDRSRLIEDRSRMVEDRSRMVEERARAVFDRARVFEDGDNPDCLVLLCDGDL